MTRSPVPLLAALALAGALTAVGCLPTAIRPLATALPGPTEPPAVALTLVPTPAAPVLTRPPSPDVTPGSRPTLTFAPTPIATLTPTPAPTPTVPPTPRLGSAPTGPTQTAQVARVVDGDTIRVLIGDVEFAVRYIGIDTPETVDPRRPVEWMGKEAARTNRQLVEGRTVVLEKDASETDRYHRLLRYVWIDDGESWLLVNLELIRRGFAHVSTYPPDVKYVDLYLDAQRAAREAGRGLWGEPP